MCMILAKKVKQWDSICNPLLRTKLPMEGLIKELLTEYYDEHEYD